MEGRGDVGDVGCVCESASIDLDNRHQSRVLEGPQVPLARDRKNDYLSRSFPQSPREWTPTPKFLNLGKVLLLGSRQYY